jgi:hypothetical protein
VAVWCRQTVEGEAVDEPYRIEPHAPDQTDAELLAAKARGAHDKGWSVEFTGPRSFTATKVRWAAELTCVRDFCAD